MKLIDWLAVGQVWFDNEYGEALTISSLDPDTSYPVEFRWNSGGLGRNSVEGFISDNTPRDLVAFLRDRALTATGPGSGTGEPTGEIERLNNEATALRERIRNARMQASHLACELAEALNRGRPASAEATYYAAAGEHPNSERLAMQEANAWRLAAAETNAKLWEAYRIPFEFTKPLSLQDYRAAVWAEALLRRHGVIPPEGEPGTSRPWLAERDGVFPVPAAAWAHPAAPQTDHRAAHPCEGGSTVAGKFVPCTEPPRAGYRYCGAHTHTGGSDETAPATPPSGSPPGAAEPLVCPGCGMTRSQRWPDDTTHPNMEKLQLRDGCYYGPVYGWYSCKVTGDLRAHDWGLSQPDGSRGAR